MFKPLLTAITAILALLLLTTPLTAGAQPSGKREFRGVWLQTVFQQQYARQSTDSNKRYLRENLDRLQRMGINAVIFQVRPSADAFYPSDLEPWSRHLTGTTGKAPRPAWDPLKFMIEECHKRGMELHAWLNPYRITTSAGETLPTGHIARKHPERCFTYAKKKYFDPGIPENRDHIVRIVTDIIERYDVDGIHFDDYFYPYPVAGMKIPDSKTFARYGRGTGMSIGDWRRHNVDMLIESVHKAIAGRKPWVRFGISPFGIWRNATSSADGSKTAGLQNYDDLYADVIKWAREGWIDYQIPQLYWEIGHKRADYTVLVRWWGTHACGRHVFVGQDVVKTMKAAQLDAKLKQAAKIPSIGGHCWWSGYNLIDNTDGIAGRLPYSATALTPEYPWVRCREQKAPGDLKKSRDGQLSWKSDARKWVVYRFDDPEHIDLDNPAAIVAVTYTRSIPADKAGVYVVTALDSANRESEASTPLLIP